MPQVWKKNCDWMVVACVEENVLEVVSYHDTQPRAALFAQALQEAGVQALVVLKSPGEDTP